MGDEAFTTCFYAFSFNGLGFSGLAEDLVLVRPEKHPRLELQGRPWNRDQILSTELFHLGYLRPDPIMRQYRDKLGSGGGTRFDRTSTKRLDRHGHFPSLEIVAAHTSTRRSSMPWACRSRLEMTPATAQGAPSLGAIASRESIHFYLMAFARWNHFPLVATEHKNRMASHYPEADLWTDEPGYRALGAEYQRVAEYSQLAKETGGEGWIGPNPDRALSPGEQKRLVIRFGLATPAPTRAAAPKSKKTARKR